MKKNPAMDKRVLLADIHPEAVAAGVCKLLLAHKALPGAVRFGPPH